MKEDMDMPGIEDERLLDSLMEDGADDVQLRGRKYKVRWLKPGTIRKFTEVMLKSGNDDKLGCQCAALILLNDFWKILFLYQLMWRWFFYVKQYGYEELVPVIAMGKKKVAVKEYFEVTMLLTAMKDTMMIMTKEEARRILQEPPTGRNGK